LRLARRGRVLFLPIAPRCGDFALATLRRNLLLAIQPRRFYLRGMTLRAISVLFAVMVLVGCPKSDTKSNKGKRGPEEKPTKDESGDVAFQAFTGRLRKAVEKRDAPTLASMMAPNFGYRWDDAAEGETPFAYWDANNLWGELASLMREKWVPHNGFMVVPPQFAASEDYRGYRAGLTMVNGSWRFAYFVSPPPATP
jgi:hypothetical protein